MRDRWGGAAGESGVRPAHWQTEGDKQATRGEQREEHRRHWKDTRRPGSQNTRHNKTETWQKPSSSSDSAALFLSVSFSSILQTCSSSQTSKSVVFCDCSAAVLLRSASAWQFQDWGLSISCICLWASDFSLQLPGSQRGHTTSPRTQRNYICTLYISSAYIMYISNNNIQHPMYIFNILIFQCLSVPSAVCQLCTC